MGFRNKYDYIDFEESLAFTNMYTVRSLNRAETKKLFTSDVMSCLLENRGISMEAYDQTIIMYYPRVVFKNEDISNLLDICFEVYELMTNKNIQTCREQLAFEMKDA